MDNNADKQMDHRRILRTKIIFTLFLAVIEVLLTAAGWGYFTVGRIAFTILHIPVFIATILIGLWPGVLVAGVFGMTSFQMAFIDPKGFLDYLFQDPRISILPRLMIPFAVWLIYRAVRKLIDDRTISAQMVCAGFASMGGVIANAAFVIISLAFLYPEAVGITEDLSASTIVITNIIAINMVYEIAIAIFVTCLAVLIVRKYSILPDTNEGQDRSIRKTFRKWLLLFMMLFFSIMLFYLYSLFTHQDRHNAEMLLNEKAGDVARMISSSGKPVHRNDLTIGSTGFVTLSRDDVIIKSGLKSLDVRLLSDMCPEYDEIEKGIVYDMELNGIYGAGMVSAVDDIVILSFLPDSEIYAERNHTLAALLGGLLFLYMLLYVTISTLLQRNVVQRIQDVNDSLSQIRSGNLDEKVTAGGNTEFEELSLGINTTVDALKKTMQEIEEKNKREMEFAREVQNAALPSGSLTCAEPAVTVLGSMNAARDVGGDFYDYFLIGEDKLCVMIADVSGKGVPAALFMMTAKTMLRNLVLSGRTPAQAMQLANVQLCENNEKGMFVTAWLGILDLPTGTLQFANAAHNPPVLKKKGEPFIFMDHKKYKRSLMLAGLETTRYVNNEIHLGSGDMLFLYTDGVTEAANAAQQLYGEERLLQCLEENYTLAPADLIRTVRADIDAFAAGTEQFDDITITVLNMEAFHVHKAQ